MDRVNQLRGEAGGSEDSTLDTSSPPSETFMSANDNSSKYFSIDDSTFDITPIKDVSLASTSSDGGRSAAENDELISNLSPIGKKEIDSYKIGKEIEAANILSGGVEIFDDNSFEGNELVIDDNVESEDKFSTETETLIEKTISKNAPIVEETVAQMVRPVSPVKPAAQLTEPKAHTVDSTALLVEASDQVIEPAVQMLEPTAQLEEPAGHLEKPSLPMIEAVAQVAESEAPIVDPVELLVEAPVLMIEPTGQSEKSSLPSVEAAGQLIEPASQLIGPVVPQVELVAPQVEPLVPQVEPVAPQLEPVALQVEHAAPYLEPVAPFVEPVAPLVEPVAPLVENVAAEVEPVAPQVHPAFQVVAPVPQLMEPMANAPVVMEPEPAPNREMEVFLHIDGNNVNAIDIGNGLYLYRKGGQEELAAVQILNNDPQTFKFLKVRDNAEGNLEVYEEIEVEVPKEVPTKEGKKLDKNKDDPNVPILDKKSKNEPSTSHKTENKSKSPEKEPVPSTSKSEQDKETVEAPTESRTDINLNVKMKSNEPRKSPVIGSFTPMMFHSTPNKEGKPLTKTMVDFQLDPNRHSDNIRKTIEVHTDTTKKITEAPIKEIENVEFVDTIHVDNAPSNNSVCINRQNDKIKNKNFKKEQSNNDEMPKAESDTCKEVKNMEHIVIDAPSSSNSSPKITIGNNEVKHDMKLSSKAVMSTSKIDDINVKNDKEKFLNNKILQNLPEHKQSDHTSKIKIKNFDINSSENKETIQDISKQISQINETAISIHSNSSKAKSSQVLSVEYTENAKDENMMKIPLESIPDVSSSCTNIENEEPKEESITLYSIDTDESVSLKTPSISSKDIDDKVVISDNISKVLSTISSITHIQNEYNNINTDKVTPVINSNVSEINSAHGDGSYVISQQEISSIPEQSHKVYINKKDLKAPTKSNANVPETKQPEKVSNIYLPEMNKDFVDTSSNSSRTMINKIENVENNTGLSMNSSGAPNIKPSEIEIPTEDITPQPPKELSANTIGPIEKSHKINIIPNISQVDTKITTFPLPSKATTKCQNKSSVAQNANGSVKKQDITEQSESSANFGVMTVGLNPELSSATTIRPLKPESHIPIISIASKPNSKSIHTRKVETKFINTNQNAEAQNITEVSKHAEAKNESLEIKEPKKRPLTLESKPNNNNAPAVPFGKWTDAHRQEFVNKFKEVKASVNSNSKQIKNSNDLNRRDVLQKIDSQRAQTISNATLKGQEKANIKPNSVFTNKAVSPVLETDLLPKSEACENKHKPVLNKAVIKQENIIKTCSTSTMTTQPALTNINICKAKPSPLDQAVAGKIEDTYIDKRVKGKLDSDTKKISAGKIETSTQKQNTASCFMASLIDRTIEGMINRSVLSKHPDDIKQNISTESAPKIQKAAIITQSKSQPSVNQPVSLDDIEMKMNELHGIPFVERPPHELPKMLISELKTYSRINVQNPSLASKTMKNTTESEDEQIEHEPVTGDVQLKKRIITLKKPTHEINDPTEMNKNVIIDKSISKNESDIPSEKDFEKFATRNSVTYENCLTVSIDNKEELNIVQTMKEKILGAKIIAKHDPLRNELKCNYQNKPCYDIMQVKRKQDKTTVDHASKKSQSKIHSAYQSAVTAKHIVSQPISIIEDKPVKVVFLDSNLGFVPSQLNVQGKELSPAKKSVAPTDAAANENDSVDSVALKTNAASTNKHDVVSNESKQQEKVKSKHQRKQVLTPVEPHLEVIPSNDINEETPTKKKRKLEDSRSKNLVPKKTYLLERSIATTGNTSIAQVLSKDAPNEVALHDPTEHKNTASAIDNLVKAAELLENQAVNKNVLPNSDTPITPQKRGRGRPRKYPLPEGGVNKTPSPQKKPRLIDAKLLKQTSSVSDDLDDGSSGDEMVRENWTMGKINENIVCPICNKLFRSENVVFKHVKHCTGVSPSRSDSEKRSPRRSRMSQESEDADIDDDISISEIKKRSSKERRSNEFPSSQRKPTEKSPFAKDSDDIIVIEDTPIKDSIEKSVTEKEEIKKGTFMKTPHSNNSYVCEICGKSFRQQSYLLSHKLLHKKEIAKKNEKNVQQSNKSNIFSCEVCKKQFRKLHHLVQHRINHNIELPKRTLRKSSLEQNDVKNMKENDVAKQNEDASAGFRCEPCDKSFRKLHHLVEHRGTHDSSNRHKPPTIPQPPSGPDHSSPLPPRCDICDKSFRKLHHLIEHKEQHAETNQHTDKSDEEKNKVASSSDKLDDKKNKSVLNSEEDDKKNKGALSTKDIIHECSLCYMVFPNEHSLNKHSGICSKKKRQSKLPKNTDTVDNNSGTDKEYTDETNITGIDLPKIIATAIIEDDEDVSINEKNNEMISDQIPENQNNVKDFKTSPPQKILENEKITEITISENLRTNSPIQIEENRRGNQNKTLIDEQKRTDVEKNQLAVFEMEKKTDLKDKNSIETVRKKLASKGKTNNGNVTKRAKSLETLEAVNHAMKIINPSAETVKPNTESIQHINLIVKPTEDPVKPAVESSDDDEIRYMFNPNMKIDDSNDSKNFMKVRAKKRNSLQIERPNNDAAKRRTSLQHPPKIPRLKPKIEIKSKVGELKSNRSEPKLKIAEKSKPDSKPKTTDSRNKLETKTKPIEVKNSYAPTVKTKIFFKNPEAETAQSTDSEDSDIKYSFPAESPPELDHPSAAEKDSKTTRKSLAEKRKSLGSIAKRKSTGKPLTAKHKNISSPVKSIRKRWSVIEHRCDCGELFSSAALLARHTTLAHTPPRVRRRRDLDPSTQASSSRPAAGKEVSSVRQSAKPTSSANPTSSTKPTSSANPTSSTKPTSSDKLSTTSKPSGSVKVSKTSVKSRSSVKPGRSTKSSNSVKPSELDTSTLRKTRRRGAHSGVPVPEKMRKIMMARKKDDLWCSP